jgi:muramoyltetrapeptide carboxypeptidase LdcA involved in peptidoglycan recycling
VEFTYTKKLGATGAERCEDLIRAFEDNEIKAVIATLGGDDQVTYIKNLPAEPFISNPKMFFGYSDNTHFHNFLWLNGIPSFYGASLFTQFGTHKRMDDLTVQFIKHAMFDEGEFELTSSPVYNDIGLDWGDLSNLGKERVYEDNEGWYWDGDGGDGIAWGGCLESIDEMLRHNISIPSLGQFENIVLYTETSEEIPSADYVHRVYRALGERGILERVQGILVGRPKAWHFNVQHSAIEKKEFKEAQRRIILETVRKYNPKVPIVQNMDFGHTDPQICIPSGRRVRIDGNTKQVFAQF